jgi:F-type H+-transporting ATPase subunit gamma
MTTRREIEQRWRSLGEIRDIMSSMKMIAYMETRKLARFLSVQQRMLADIEEMAGDLLAHFPGVGPPPAPPRRAAVLLGTERGFCGEFNEDLARWLDATGSGLAPGSVIAVGRRLGIRLADERRVRQAIEGASASEDVPAVLDAIAQAIAPLQQPGGVELAVVYHGHEPRGLRERLLFPPFADRPQPKRRYSHPPLLDLPPQALFAALLDRYLFAALHATLYTSLMAENEHRVQHLDAAIRHLDDRRGELARRGRVLRQEEIVEEIEVILLSVETPVVPRAATGSGHAPLDAPAPRGRS